jgi:hypothetical protein
MKRYIQNPETKNFIDADGPKGKKIIKEKMEKNEQIELFCDKAGTIRSSNSCVVPKRTPKKKEVAKKEGGTKKKEVAKKEGGTKKKEVAKKKGGTTTSNHHVITPIQEILSPREEEVRRPDPPRVMRLIDVPPPISIPDILSHVLNESMNTMNEDNLRRGMINSLQPVVHSPSVVRHHNPFSHSVVRHHSPLHHHHEHPSFDRDDLDNDNIRNFRIRKLTILKKNNNKEETQAQEQKHRLQKENKKLKEQLEKETKLRKQRQKRLNAIKKRHGN